MNAAKSLQSCLTLCNPIDGSNDVKSFPPTPYWEVRPSVSQICILHVVLLRVWILS